MHVPEHLDDDTEVPDIGTLLDMYGNKGLDFIVDTGTRVATASTVSHACNMNLQQHMHFPGGGGGCTCNNYSINQQMIVLILCLLHHAVFPGTLAACCLYAHCCSVMMVLCEGHGECSWRLGCFDGYMCGGVGGAYYTERCHCRDQLH